MVYDPYPEYGGNEYRKEFTGEFRACEGPRGKNLDRWNPEDTMSIFPGIPRGNFQDVMTSLAPLTRLQTSRVL
jgi:hypothetical protein